MQRTECPWGSLAPANVDWCEANICGWVVEPTNTYSTLSYIILGLLIWRYAIRWQLKGLLAIYGPGLVFTGVTAGIYHASATNILQYLDLLGIFAVISLFLVFNLTRLNLIAVESQVKWYFWIALGVTLILPLFEISGIPMQLIAVTFGLCIAVQELWLWLSKKEVVNYRYLLLAILFFIVAAFFVLADLKRLWCQPNSLLFQGHATWHLFSALSLFTSFFYYKQFTRS